MVLVGRGARHLLGEMPGVFHLRLVALREWRAGRMAQLEGWPPDEARARCLEADDARGFHTIFFRPVRDGAGPIRSSRQYGPRATGRHDLHGCRDGSPRFGSGGRLARRPAGFKSFAGIGGR